MLLGIALGARAVAINRYLTEGYPQLALATFRSFLNRDTVGVVLCFLLIEITFLLLVATLSRCGRKVHGLNAAFWVLVATGANIDRLAREGVLFQRAIAQWPKTSPSFASMMSSTCGHTATG